MNIAQIGFIVLAVVICVLGVLVVFIQAAFIRELKKEYDKLMRELEGVFGWESYNWLSRFRDYARTANKAKEKVDKLYNLPLIKQALEVQRLEDLEREKVKVDQEIERLKK